MGKAALQWTEAMLAALGQEQDAVLAARWGTTAKTVNLKRNALGIAAFGRVQWTPEMLAALGQDSDAAVAARFGLSKASVVAKRLSVHAALGQAAPGRGSRAAFDWTPQALALLGTDSDAAVAQQLGLSRLTVYNARVARGIAPAGRKAAGPAALGPDPVA